MNTLKDLKIGDSSRITKIGSVGALKQRFMDMGITKGEIVKVEKIAPLGDPIEITIRGYRLSIRKSDAEKIEME